VTTQNNIYILETKPNFKKASNTPTSTYSQDLREKVAAYLAQGPSQRQASKTFNIHKNTINRWNTKYAKEGKHEARKRLGLASKVDQAKFE